MAWDSAPPTPEELKRSSAPRWDAEPPKPEELGKKSLGIIGTGLKAIDSVTGAPARAAIYAAQGANTPGDIPSEALKAAKGQFGNMRVEAPTGADIAERAGLSNEPLVSKETRGKVPPGLLAITKGTPIGFLANKLSEASPADIAGVGIDLAANPVNALGPAAKVAAKGAELAAPIAKGLSSFAHEKALKAAGAMTKDFRIINDKGMQDILGSFLLENDLVTPLSTVSKVGERLSAAKQIAGETIGHILDTADAGQTVRIKASDMAFALASDPEILALKNIPGKEATYKQVRRYISTLQKNGNELSLREAQKLRQGIDSSINFNKRVPDMAGAQPYLYKMRDALSKAMTDAVDAIDQGQPFVSNAPRIGEAGAPTALGRLKEANLAYSKLAQLEKIADSRIGNIQSNRGISLTDTIAGAGGMALGHSPMGAATTGAGLALANKAGRTFGNPLMATGANKAAKVLKSAPEALSEVSPDIGPRLSTSGLLHENNKKKASKK